MMLLSVRKYFLRCTTLFCKTVHIVGGETYLRGTVPLQITTEFRLHPRATLNVKGTFTQPGTNLPPAIAGLSDGGS